MVQPLLGLWTGLVLFTNSTAPAQEPTTSAIVRDKEASFAETMAAKEIRRYLYLRTGLLWPLRLDDAAPEQTWILVGTKHRASVQALLADPALKESVQGLAEQEFLLRTVRHGDRAVWLIAGGDGIGALYGAYRFAEHLGVRFYLDGDVVPDTQTAIALPNLNEVARPLFRLRGIHPRHGFPEGPDWWDADAYKAVLGQLPKLRMNFIGLHSHSAGQVGPEPTVWIGLSEEIGPGAAVKSSYPARHFTTLPPPSPEAQPAWGFRPAKTGDYYFGADALFDQDDYGADYMRGRAPWTQVSADQANGLFEDFGNLLHDAFAFARHFGVRSCIGTEVPLTVPAPLQARLLDAGKDAKDLAVVRALYEGMFRRIKQIQPLDYYWLWTPENWTRGLATDQQIQATLAELDLAAQAARHARAPFTLATCGWVLGAPQDPALFDRALPKHWPMSCLNRNVGFDPVEPGFAQIQDRPLWAIPWLEDDPAVILPQLWVGRVRKDAADALRYGCTGLIGMHWRTRIIGPNISALAQAAWDQTPWKSTASDLPLPPQSGKPQERLLQFQPARHAPCGDFYADWALAQFGPDVAQPTAALWVRLDGRLPRPSTWVERPGGIRADPRPWDQVAQEYAFVDELAALRSRVQSPGCLARFDYWLEHFRYLRAVGMLSCTWARLNDTLATIRTTSDPHERKRRAEQFGLPQLEELASQLKELHRHLLATVTSSEGMGTVANWQQHLLPMLLGPAEELLKQALDRPSLPDQAMPTRGYPGQPRLFIPVTRTALLAGEPFRLEVVVLGNSSAEVFLHWRPLGIKLFRASPIPRVARGVYRMTLLGKVASYDFEYYVTARVAGLELTYPPTAPALNQTVIVIVPGP